MKFCTYFPGIGLMVNMLKRRHFKGAPYCNQFQNVLRLFDVLPNFLFTTSERMAIITYKHGIYKLPHKFPNDLRLRKLGNIRKLSKLTSYNDGLVPSLPAEMKLLLILAENSWKTEIKLFPLCPISHGN